MSLVAQGIVDALRPSCKANPAVRALLVGRPTQRIDFWYGFWSTTLAMSKETPIAQTPEVLHVMEIWILIRCAVTSSPILRLHISRVLSSDF